jgi:hypothetical protein
MTDTPEVPPPPRTPADLYFRGRGWRASVPSAVVIALVTTIGTTISTQCSSPRAEIEKISVRLDSIEAAQRAVLDRVEHDAHDAARRDALQDAQIERTSAELGALRNR